jgi:hypothetical protein
MTAGPPLGHTDLSDEVKAEFSFEVGPFCVVVAAVSGVVSAQTLGFLGEETNWPAAD